MKNPLLSRLSTIAKLEASRDAVFIDSDLQLHLLSASELECMLQAICLVRLLLGKALSFLRSRY